MKKVTVLISLIFLLNGCAESFALLGTSVGGASNGKVVESSLQSTISYGIKKQTGKSPLGHVLTYAEEKNPEKKKDPCKSFIKKTNSDICLITKKQINLAKAKINKQKKLTSSLELTIDKSSKIKYLDE